MTLSRTLTAALAAAALAAPAAQAQPADMHASVAQAAAKQAQKQDLRSADARDAAVHTRTMPTRPVPNLPTWPAYPEPLTPPAAIQASDDGDGGVDWTTIGIGVGGSLLLASGIAVTAGIAGRTRRPVRQRVSA